VFNLYEYEYPEVIDNSKNPARLKAAWSKKINRDEAERLIKLLVRNEKINVSVNWHDNRSAFALQGYNGPAVIHFGEDLSVGLIFHEYVHVMLFKIRETGHGPLFTILLDDLLNKYEVDWS
jgi:hypothetical protein